MKKIIFLILISSTLINAQNQVINLDYQNESKKFQEILITGKFNNKIFNGQVNLSLPSYMFSENKLTNFFSKSHVIDGYCASFTAGGSNYKLEKDIKWMKKEIFFNNGVYYKSITRFSTGDYIEHKVENNDISNNLNYLKFNNVVVGERIKAFYSNDQIAAIANLYARNNSDRHVVGTQKKWSREGFLMLEENYSKNGKRNGWQRAWEYWDGFPELIKCREEFYDDDKCVKGFNSNAVWGKVTGNYESLQEIYEKIDNGNFSSMKRIFKNGGRYKYIWYDKNDNKVKEEEHNPYWDKECYNFIKPEEKQACIITFWHDPPSTQIKLIFDNLKKEYRVFHENGQIAKKGFLENEELIKKCWNENGIQIDCD